MTLLALRPPPPPRPPQTSRWHAEPEGVRGISRKCPLGSVQGDDSLGRQPENEERQRRRRARRPSPASAGVGRVRVATPRSSSEQRASRMAASDGEAHDARCKRRQRSDQSLAVSKRSSSYAVERSNPLRARGCRSAGRRLGPALDVPAPSASHRDQSYRQQHHAGRLWDRNERPHTRLGAVGPRGSVK